MRESDSVENGEGHRDPPATRDPTTTGTAAHLPALGPYRLLSELGRGGMGVVYLAENTKLKRRIALKILTARLARESAALEAFEREAQLLAAITHPNVATIYTLEEIDGQHLLTMELIPGPTLAELLTEGPLSLDTTLAIGRQIAAALEATHARNIIHRDLKPANIKVTSEGLVKVLDFGIARIRARDPDDTLPVGQTREAFCGTPGYMSPEQLREENIDHRSDVWAFGCVLFECLTGRRAFPGDTLSERVTSTLNKEPEFSALPRNTPPPVSDLVIACLTKEAEERPSSITDVRRELEEQLAVHRLSIELPTPRTRVRRGTSSPNNLPRRLASFVGRSRQIHDVKNLVDASRLVTLTGTGGCGKTRLALEAAEELLPRFADGVWFTEVAPLAAAERLLPAVAEALGVKEQPDQKLADTVRDYLRGKRLLIILDNCEHLLESCAEIAESLVLAHPDLRILATSREGLGITGETIYQVPPLPIPDEDRRLPLKRLGEVESVRLFVERAHAVNTDFHLSDDNAPAIVQVVRRLDGIPLALELAAARARALSVEEIANRLDDRFGLLTEGSKTSLPRHQTLQAMVDWSYFQLAPGEQTLFRRLSIFAGGWTLDAAETVCIGEGIDSWEFLDLHSRLVGKSLVEMDTTAVRTTGKARYRLLETLRQYGHTRLQEAGEVDRIRRRHLHYYVALVEEAEPNLRTLEQTDWFVRLGLEHDNLRAAFSTCNAADVDPELGLRLAGALGRFWMIRGHWSEGRSLCNQQLSRVDPDHATVAHARALNAAGNLAFHQGDYGQARGFHEAALDMRRALGDRHGEAMSFNNLGEVARLQAQYDRAQRCYETSLEIQTEIGDRWGAAVSLNNLGELTQNRGDFALARGFHERALALWPDLGDRWGMAWSLSNLGYVAVQQGDLSEGRSFYQRSLETSRRIGDRFGIALSLHALGTIAVKQHDYHAAQRRFQEALAIRAHLGDRRGIVESLEAYAALAAAQAEPERAARLLGVAEAQREAIDAPASAAAKDELETLISELRGTLGEETLARLWTTGRTTSLDEALDQAGGA